MGRIPDRWKEYTGSGKPIKGAPIIAFKTPLARKYNAQVQPNADFVEEPLWFTPTDVVETIRTLDCELTCVIDLTNTFRYYDGNQEFAGKHNIRYQKVKCEGQKVPNDDVMKQVGDIISREINRNGRESTKVVGIHCTHGVNRTGYLIARYLIEWLGYEPSAAIEDVNEARGYSIEREAYLEDLRNRSPGDRLLETPTLDPETDESGTSSRTNEPIHPHPDPQATYPHHHGYRSHPQMQFHHQHPSDDFGQYNNQHNYRQRRPRWRRGFNRNRSRYPPRGRPYQPVRGQGGE